ncbi:extracellular solute-binding protein [Microbacterium sp. 22242]|uniref:extracellular solute-binding protein n=1 Tax=Microbacterium sp. 22242 TaxID=3453896 RepID=UPI003F8792AE
MTTATRRARRLIPVLALVGAGVLALSACSGSGGGTSAGGAGSAKFSYLGQTENTTIVGTLKSLAKNECAAADKAAPLTTDSSAGAQFDQKLQLLSGQNALSNMQMAAGTPSLMKQFIKSGQLLDLSKQLDKLGVSDRILPAAASTIKSLYGQDDLYALPTEFNIEGLWYNKKLLADAGVTEAPKTWDELVADAAKLKSGGVQPFAADGKDGWPITRLVGDYIFRDLGQDALKDVADGKAKLTDAKYVKAADAVADLGKKGYFGDAVGSVDYNAAMNEFLTGKAGFFYMGSWALANFNDKTQNKIGVDDIGFAPFPAVAGGKGSIDQIPANVGVPVMFGSKDWGANQDAWLKCIATNYGPTVLKDSGVVSGFTVADSSASSSPVTKIVQDTVKNAPSTVLWFEASFTPKGTTVSQTNGSGLGSGSLSGEQFMQLVQAANDAG